MTTPVTRVSFFSPPQKPTGGTVYVRPDAVQQGTDTPAAHHVEEKNVDTEG